MPLDLSWGAFVYCLLVLGFFAGAWWHYDRRDRSFSEEGRHKAVFHCIRCDKLYTAPRMSELSLCPRCGHENVRLKF